VRIRHGVVEVIGRLSRVANGDRVRIDLRIGRRHIRFSGKVRHGKLHVRHRLPRSLRHRRSGVVTIRYAGNGDVRSARLRLVVRPRHGHRR
jgi:hypothetical protein